MNLKAFLGSPIGKVLEIFATVGLFFLLSSLLIDFLGIDTSGITAEPARYFLIGVLGIVMFLFAFLAVRTGVAAGSGQRVNTNVLAIIGTEIGVFIVAAVLSVLLYIGTFSKFGLYIL